MTAGVRLERTQPLCFIDHLVHVHIDGDASDGTLALAEERGRRGDMPPLHVHHRDDEAFYVIAGELSLFVAGEHLVLATGQAALAPREVPHSYRVESEEAHWLVITTPAGFESFVREVAEPAPADELPASRAPARPGRPGSGRRQGRHRDPRPSRRPAGGVTRRLLDEAAPDPVRDPLHLEVTPAAVGRPRTGCGVARR
jgi:mannose-6-phosphate isomerase-like protein (cupin superfamily)